MYICMYVCMYVFMYICMYVCIYVCIYYGFQKEDEVIYFFNSKMLVFLWGIRVFTVT